MMTITVVSIHRRRRSDVVAAAAIAMAAVLVCVICLVNGDAAPCGGAMLVFGMGIAAVLAGRSSALQAPVRRISDRCFGSSGITTAFPATRRYPRLARIT